jgi:tumor protein p63
MSEDLINISGELLGHNDNYHKLETLHYSNYSMNHHPPIMEPEHFNALPMIDDLETPWSFEINLNSENSGKTSWMFSTKLNKAYVKINSYLNIYPKYEVQNPNEEIFLRAMIVYTSQNEINEPVTKCPNHRDQAKRENVDKPEHILRCPTKDTLYLGTEDGKLFRDKLSIRIPMKNVACNEPIKLLFTCQNSCSSGMNRKSTSLIFTLENNNGDLFGRHVLHFKVCSCPKRDKDKEELAQSQSNVKFVPKKRKLESTAPSTSRKIPMTTLIKQESDVSLNEQVNSTIKNPIVKNEEVCELRLVLPNSEMKQKIINCTMDVLAGEMHRKSVNYEHFINNLKQSMDK